MPVKKETKEKKTVVKKTVAKEEKVKEPKKIASKKVVEKKIEPEKVAEIIMDEKLADDEIDASEVLANLDGKTKYFEAVGRRKTSVARVRLFTQGKKEITVNGKNFDEYFTVASLQREITAPLQKINCLGKFGVSIVVKGGGMTGQAEATRHGVARALVLLNPYFKKRLKKSGYLTRDSRMRERKKPGLKRARRAPQWSKR